MARLGGCGAFLLVVLGVDLGASFQVGYIVRLVVLRVLVAGECLLVVCVWGYLAVVAFG